MRSPSTPDGYIAGRAYCASSTGGSRWLGIPEPDVPVARKPNYDFEKRRKEQERKAKKDAKRARRIEEGRADGEIDQADGADGAEPGEHPPETAE